MRDVAHLDALQRQRTARDPPLRHQTRNMPKRAAEIVAEGGCLYWVIAGAILVRQRITDIVDDVWDDGARCTGFVLDPALIRVVPRPCKAFQGWRYLDPAAAPPDLSAASTASDDLPADLRLALSKLSLL